MAGVSSKEKGGELHGNHWLLGTPRDVVIFFFFLANSLDERLFDLAPDPRASLAAACQTRASSLKSETVNKSHVLGGAAAAAVDFPAYV